MATLQIKTIDSFQGGEHAVAIANLTVADRIGFLRDPMHLNVACPGAKHGAFFIGNTQKAEKEQRVKRRVVQKVIDFGKKNRLVRRLATAPVVPDWMGHTTLSGLM